MNSPAEKNDFFEISQVE